MAFVFEQLRVGNELLRAAVGRQLGRRGKSERLGRRIGRLLINGVEVDPELTAFVD